VRSFASVLCLIAGLAAPAAVSAHPHVFISNRMSVEAGRGVLKGIHFEWTFDEMFTRMILADYHASSDGTFSGETIKALKAGAFDNLKNYHYFIELFHGSAPVRGMKIEEFTPRVNEKGRLVYSFFVPLKLTVTPEDQTLRVTVYDDSYFVAFHLMKTEDVTVDAPQSFNCSLSIEKKKVKAQWPGQYMPDQLVIRFKEGL
jgi:ABC-type uncharacterized transport system substrate-binding protein